MSERVLGIRFGAVAAPITEQLAQQDLKLEAIEGVRVQANADAITRLHLHGMLTDHEAHRARRRLMKYVLRAARQQSQEADRE